MAAVLPPTGEQGVLSSETRSATVAAHTRGTATRIPGRLFRAYLDRNPAVLGVLWWTAALVYATEYGQRRPEVALQELAKIARTNAKLDRAVSAGSTD